MVGADGLHMTDAGYGCLALDLAAALEANWRADRKLAQRPRGGSNAVAGLPPAVAEHPSAVGPAPAMRLNDATPFN